MSSWTGDPAWRPAERHQQGMSSPMFYHLSDADLVAILVFIRSEPVGDGPATEVQLGLLGRWPLLFGGWLPYVEEIDHQAARLDPGGPTRPLVWGAIWPKRSAPSDTAPTLLAVVIPLIWRLPPPTP